MGESDLDRVSTVNCDSDVGNQPGDTRTRERRKFVVNVQPRVVDTVVDTVVETRRTLVC